MSELHSESQPLHRHHKIRASTHCVRAAVSPARSPVEVCRLRFPCCWQTQCHCLWCGVQAPRLSPPRFLLPRLRSLACSQVLRSSCLWAPQPFQAPTAASGRNSMSTLFYSNRIPIPLFCCTYAELIERCLVPSASLRISVWNWLFLFCCAFYTDITFLHFLRFVVRFTVTSQTQEGLIWKNTCYPALPPLRLSSRYH